MSDEESLDFAADQSLHIAPIASTNPRTHKNKLFLSINPHQPSNKNQSLPVLTLSRDNGKPAVNDSFEEYLTEDDANLDAVIVSVLGPKKIGKSFLLDSLLTVDNGKVTRIMSKKSSPIINSPAQSCLNRNGDRVIYFDGDGATSHEIFLWNYFLSSIIIYNLSPSDRNEEATLIDHLSFVQSHLDSEIDDLSPPQLVIVRRDAGEREIKDRELIRKIEEYSLFAADIQVVHLPYPGKKDVKAKELLDVPIREIDPRFTTEVERLSQIIKMGKAKTIKGNYLSTKILSLTLEPLTKGLNKDHRVSTNKVWDDVIETLSIGFYNFYLKSYSEELEKEFQNEKPCDKYTIYKRLSNLKRKVNKKVEGFKNISDVPIFMKYRQKLDETIKNKENLVKQVNQAKSRAANQQYCEKLLGELNERNCAELIDEYCKSELDEQKTEVLLENFETIIKQRAKETSMAKNPDKKMTIEITELERQLAKIQNEIEVASARPAELPDYKAEIEKYKMETKHKQSELKQLQAELQDLRNASLQMSKQRGDGELEELEAECQRLNKNIAEYDEQIAKLRRDRDQRMKETVSRLEEQTKKQERELKRLEEQLREMQQMRSKVGAAQGGSKGTCCCSLM